MPFYYRPPEHVLDRNPSQPKDNLNYGELNQKTDIWALGATICYSIFSNHGPLAD